MTALRSLASDGWRTHSLQQDGLLVEECVREDGSLAVPPRGIGIHHAGAELEPAKGDSGVKR